MTTIIKTYDLRDIQTPPVMKNSIGYRNLEVRLRNGFFELWTRNAPISERWHPVKASQADNMLDAEKELYDWALAQNWAEYTPKPHTLED